jgi:hypothetical protein
LIIWEEGLDFDEDDDGASLASGHGATTIVDIGKDDRNYGTNSSFIIINMGIRSNLCIPWLISQALKLTTM